MFPGRRRRGNNFALYLLLGQMVQVGFDRIPPITLATILGQVALFLRIVPGKFSLPSITSACISTVSILKQQDYKRLLLASFFHADEWHLYYNMVSFLWKGVKLERRLGSGYFLYLILVFSVLTNIVTMGLGLAAQELTHNSYYAHQCSVGFSGVLFALKVLMNHWFPGTQYVMGMFPVPGRYVCWAELLLIQIIAPNASFLGHLAGIIVGLFYIKGPLKSMMDLFVLTQPSYTYQQGTAGHQRNTRPPRTGPSYTYASGTASDSRQNYNAGTSGYSNPGRHAPQPGSNWGHDPYRYTGGLGEDAQMQQAMRDSMQHSQLSGAYTTPSEPPSYRAPSAPTLPPEYNPPSYEDATRTRHEGLYPDISNVDSRSTNDINEEVRRRRLARFS